MAKLKTATLWLAVLGGVLLTGAIGLRVTTDLSWYDALFYTVITLTTVGYEAPPDLTPEAKLFLIVFVVSGFGIAGIALTQLAQHFFVERISEALAMRRDRRMHDAHDHWIICGLGKVGSQVAEQMLYKHIDFIAIDSDEKKVSEAKDKGCIAIVGDATQEYTLSEAGIDRAKGMVVALSSDAQSVYAVLTARALNKKLRIVARANERQGISLLYRAGADKVINPARTGAIAMYRAATSPAVADFLELIELSKDLDLGFDSLKLADDSPLVGLTLAESPLRREYNLMVIAVRRPSGTVEYNPSGDFRLEPGDEIIVLGPPKNIDALRKADSQVD